MEEGFQTGMKPEASSFKLFVPVGFGKKVCYDKQIAEKFFGLCTVRTSYKYMVP